MVDSLVFHSKQVAQFYLNQVFTISVKQANIKVFKIAKVTRVSHKGNAAEDFQLPSAFYFLVYAKKYKKIQFV